MPEQNMPRYMTIAHVFIDSDASDPICSNDAAKGSKNSEPKVYALAVRYSGL
jgi:DUF1680 family protein